MSKIVKSKLKNPNYMMTKFEFLQSLNPTMPDELIKLIFSWNRIKKSPYGNTSYYNAPKSWDGFIQGGIRVSDHWNFMSQGKMHCRTDVHVHNNFKWYVGIYDSTTGTYEIVKEYPIIQNSGSLRRQLLKEETKDFVPLSEEIEKRRAIKQKMKEGRVFFHLNE